MKFLVVVSFAILCAAPAVRGQAFSDNFTRGTDPGPLTPWTAAAGTWTVTGGTMRAGTNTLSTYATAYITNTWANYTVQGRFRFQAGAFGGGLDGRMNPATGERYSAWIYPENSPGGSNTLKLIKFQSYNSFGYTNVSSIAMAQVNLASVGTNFHTLKIVFAGTQISVSYDTNTTISMTDAEAAPYMSGSVSLDMWTDSTGYLMNVDDVTVTTSPPIASNDTFNATSGALLTVPAPGVLANDTGGAGVLTAALLTSPTHGTFSFNSNGSLTYTATNGYVGNDSFTYRANDGVTNSPAATVTIVVGANHAPVANADNYSVIINTPLTVAAPGVLANDTDADGNNLTAALIATTTNGTLSFSANGGFTYTPNGGFSGNDTFTYRANDGLSNSATVAVTISVLSLTPLFTDDFTRGADPGPITPWLAHSGTWSATGGVLRGGTNTSLSYGFAYLTNTWTNFSVQARVRLPAGAFGGGVGGRVNTGSGAHYTAWIYPEGSSGGANTLKLYKFQDWSTFSYNGSFVPIQQVALGAVGTNFHTLKVAFAQKQIAVYFDGTQMMSETDTEATPLSTGSVATGFWTDAAGYTMSVDDVLVARLANDDTYSVSQDGALNVAAPGVLANDTEVYGVDLAAAVVAGPTNGTLTLNTDGSFTYTPHAGYVGADSFIYRANDASTNVGTARAAITVVAINHVPVLPAQTNRTMNELAALTVTNKATDSDLPAQTLTYQLLNPPTGAAIDANGVITWTPTEAQGPSTNTITTKVTDNGAPPASATNSFTVTVNEVNLVPTLPAQTNRTMNELTLLTVTNTATDADLPAQTLTYSFLNAPTNAAISASGVITWTPTEAQGPGAFTITTRVVDNGTPALSATNSFIVTVNEVNSAPVLPNQTNRAIMAQTTLTITNTATDTDIPLNHLNYTLLAAPTNAAISTNGIISWTPAADQDNSTNLFITRVADDGSPPLSATNSYTVFVNSNPLMVLNSATLAQESCSTTNNAIDPGEGVTVLFSLKNVGLGNTTNLIVTLLETNGVVVPSAPQSYGTVVVGGAAVTHAFTFAATGACGSVISATLQMQDGGLNLGTVSASFPMGSSGTIFTQNFDSVTAPALPAGWTTVASGFQSNWFTTNAVVDTASNAAFCGEAANVGVSELVSPVINLPLGASQLTFKHRYAFEAGGTATNGFDGGVLEIKIGTNVFKDITNAGGSFVSGGYNRQIDGRYSNPLTNRWAWGGTNGASFVATVVDLPATAAGQPIQLKWRCGTDNGNGAGGWRVDSIGITGAACCGNNAAPTLTSQADRSIAELATLVVTNTASDDPANTLSYRLVNPTAGAQIDSSGIITWIPTEAQGPSTNTFTTIVSDNAFPSQSATNSFTVVVNEINLPPILPAQTNMTIVALTSVVVTNSAFDPDIPINGLSYSLLAAPTNATIDADGVIRWTPVPAQVPSVQVFTTVVTDFNPAAVNNQHLSATNSFTVTVNAIHNGPALASQSDWIIDELTILRVTNTASDADIPALTLNYTLLAPPAGAQIDTNGIIIWAPSEAQGPSTNIITTVVTDNGAPPLSATNSFVVVVNEVNSPPSLPALPNRTLYGLTTLTVTNTASDSDLPVNSLIYVLVTGPDGAVIDANGLITWTPVSTQLPSTNTFTTIVTDYNPSAINSQHLSATNTFTVTVAGARTGPSLPPQNNLAIVELTTLTVTNTASDGDAPPPVLTYLLMNPPAGAAIDTNGIITWIPSEAQGPSSNVITTVVLDDSQPPLAATNSFVVLVREVNLAPTLPAQANRTIATQTTLTVTNTASDLDLPSNHLAYVLVDPPAGALISSNGVITWTPTLAQAATTNTLTTIVTDDGIPALSATNSFLVTVSDSTAPPHPQILSLTLSNGIATITWTTVAGRNYRVQYNDDLGGNTWTNVSPDVPGTASTASTTSPLGTGPKRFYRVMVVP